MHQLIYLLGLFFSIPLLPFLKRDGNKVRRNVPTLDEAKDPTGTFPHNQIPVSNILFLGESTIAGVGVDSHKDGIAGNFCKRYYNATRDSCSWTVVAKSGYTAKLVNAKLIIHIPKKKFDLIIIGLGANDAFTLNSPRKWSAEINELINRLQTRFQDVPILFLNMPPIKAFPAMTGLLKLTIGNLVNLLGANLKQIVNSKEGVYYNSEKIILETWSRKYNLPMDDPSVYFSDGIHPAMKTYELWADSALEFLVNKKVIPGHRK